MTDAGMARSDVTQAGTLPQAIEGVGLVSGQACGPAWIVRSAAAPVLRTSGDRATERERLEVAVGLARDELRSACDAARGNTAAVTILRAHLALLDDPAIREGVAGLIQREGLIAEEAVGRTAATLAAAFKALSDSALRARAADIADVCGTIARHLEGAPAPSAAPDEPSVVCAVQLSPLDVLQVSRGPVVGFVLEGGTESSHAGILIRALDVPAVIQVAGLTSSLREGELVLVDGSAGRVVVRPSEPWPAGVTPPRAPAADLDPATTRDGVTIAIRANIGNPHDARIAAAVGADGVGLLRTEFLFLGRTTPPSVDDHVLAYTRAIDLFPSHVVTVRLFDIAGDKRPAWLDVRPPPGRPIDLRGVRLARMYPDVARDQLHALLRASRGRQIRCLVPMVVDAAELTRIREEIAGLALTFDEGTTRASHIQLGAMVETPAAAILAEELASVADFLSIGTNDLTQYVLAVNREEGQGPSLYDPLHPSIVRILRDVAATGLRHGKPVTVCGELAADPLALPLLVGIGIRDLSVRPAAVARVKSAVRALIAADATRLAADVATLTSAAAVRSRLRAYPEDTGGVRETRDDC
jgi:phosphoenolpyruvate-protein phosphotransferase